MAKTGFDNELLRQNLMRLMKERDDLSAYALAKEAGVDKVNVQNIIAGKNKNPGMQTLYSIADTLGCTLDELVGRNTMDAVIAQPINEKFLEAAIDALKKEFGQEIKDMTMTDWCNALKDVYAGIANVKSRKKENSAKQSSETGT